MDINWKCCILGLLINILNEYEIFKQIMWTFLVSNVKLLQIGQKSVIKIFNNLNTIKWIAPAQYNTS